MSWDDNDTWNTRLGRLEEREPDWGEPPKPNPLFEKWKADPGSIPDRYRRPEDREPSIFDSPKTQRERENLRAKAAHRILDALAGKAHAPPSIHRLKSLRAAQFAEGLTDEEAGGLEEAYQAELGRLTAAGREDSTDFRKRYLGDPDLAASYLGPARTLLGLLKNDMAFNQLDQGMRRALIPIDERIEFGPVRGPAVGTDGSVVAGGSTDPPLGGGAKNDWLLNPSGQSASGEGVSETLSRRITGNVYLYALSNHGIDEVWIDARSITTIEEKEVLAGGLEYFPYLWVGIATEGGGNSPTFTGEFHLRTDWFRHVGLHVFEPLTDGELATVLDSFAHVAGYKHYAGSTSSGLFTNGASNRFPLGPFPSQFSQDCPGEVQEPTDIWYSDDKLYYMGHGVAGSLAPDRESPDARLWQKAVCLDPEDPVKNLSSTGPFMYGNHTYGGYVLDSKDWHLKGKVKGGKYLIKLNAFYGPTCSHLAGPAFDVIVKIIVGKLPGRQTIQEIRLPFPQSQWSEFERDIYPNADPEQPDPESFYQSPGPNPHAQMWWQQAVQVDVLLGIIGQTTGVTLPPWGFVPSSPLAIKEICWLAYSQTAHNVGGIIESRETDCEPTGPGFRSRAMYVTATDEEWVSGTPMDPRQCKPLPISLEEVTSSTGGGIPISDWGPYHSCSGAGPSAEQFFADTGWTEGGVCLVNAIAQRDPATGADGIYRFPEGYIPAPQSVPDGETIEYPYGGFELTADPDCQAGCGKTSVTWQEQPLP